MQVQPKYCNICNIKIPAADFETEKAIQYENYFYCSKCKEKALKIIKAWQDATKDAPDPSKTKRRQITRSAGYSSSRREKIPGEQPPVQETPPPPSGRLRPRPRPDEPDSEEIFGPSGTSDEFDSAAPTEIFKTAPKPAPAPPPTPPPIFDDEDSEIDLEMPLMDYTDVLKKSAAPASPPPKPAEPAQPPKPAPPQPPKRAFEDAVTEMMKAPAAPPQKKEAKPVPPPPPQIEEVEELEEIEELAEVEVEEKPPAPPQKAPEPVKPAASPRSAAPPKPAKEEDLDIRDDELKIEPDELAPAASEPADSASAPVSPQKSPDKSQKFSAISHSVKRDSKKSAQSISDAEKNKILAELGIGSGSFSAVSEEKKPSKRLQQIPAKKEKSESVQDASDTLDMATVSEEDFALGESGQIAEEETPAKESGKKAQTPPQTAARKTSTRGPMVISPPGAKKGPSVQRRKSKAPLVIFVIIVIAAAAAALYFLVVAPPRETAVGTGKGTVPKGTTIPQGTVATVPPPTGTGETENTSFVESPDLWKQEADSIRLRIADIPSNPDDYSKICLDIANLAVKAEGLKPRLDEAENLQKEADSIFDAEALKSADGAIEKSRALLAAGNFSEAVSVLAASDSPYSKFPVWKDRVRQQADAASNAELQAQEYARKRGEYSGNLAGIDGAALQRFRTTLAGFDAIPRETKLGVEIAGRIGAIDAELESRRAREAAFDAEYARMIEKADSLVQNKQAVEAIRMLADYAKKNPGGRYADGANAKAQSIRDELERRAVAEFYNKRDLAGWSGDKSAWRAQGDTLVGYSTSERAVIFKGDESWSSYTLKFKIRIIKGDFAVSFGSIQTPQPKTGYEFALPSEVCDPDKYYKFTFELSGGKLVVKSDLSPVPTVTTLEKTSGPVGFVLRRSGSVYLSEIEFSLNEGDR